MSFVSIIIPTFNAGAGFAEVLDGLKKQRVEGRLEIIIIDSSSTDSTAVVARQAGARVEIIDRATFNHGDTRNRAIGLSSGEFVVLLSQDAIPENEHMVANLIGNFAESRVAGVYGRHVPRTGADPFTQRQVRQFCGSPVRRVASITNRRAYEEMTPRERFELCRFDNVCSAIRRSVWQAQSFGTRDFAEDLEWSKRVLEAGWKIVYEPEAAVIHSHALSLKNHYRRSYQTHQALRDIFDLQMIASRRRLLGELVAQIPGDASWAWKNGQGLRQKMRFLSATPLRSICSLVAAYRGAKSAGRKPLRAMAGRANRGAISRGSARHGAALPKV